MKKMEKNNLETRQAIHV